MRFWRPGCRRLLLALLLLGLAGSAYLAAQLHAFYDGPLPADGTRELAGRHAAWLAHRWFDDRDRLALTDQEVDDLAERCQRLGIVYLFLHVGPLDARGRIPDREPGRFEKTAARLRRQAPEVKLLAWLGGLNQDFYDPASDTLDLTAPPVRAGIVETARSLREAGFDGIHYDLEPVRDGDPSFLLLLRETRAACGPPLSVATPHLRPPGAPALFPFERMWTRDYYRQVDARCEQLVYMGYDTAQPSQDKYARWVRWETRELCALARGELLVGVPTYDQERTPWHDPRAETLTAALRGVAAASPASPTGVAVYSEWTTGPEEWQELARWCVPAP